jgi:hypothetical protein
MQIRLSQYPYVPSLCKFDYRSTRMFHQYANSTIAVPVCSITMQIRLSQYPYVPSLCKFDYCITRMFHHYANSTIAVHVCSITMQIIILQGQSTIPSSQSRSKYEVDRIQYTVQGTINGVRACNTVRSGSRCALIKGVVSDVHER